MASHVLHQAVLLIVFLFVLVSPILAGLKSQGFLDPFLEIGLFQKLSFIVPDVFESQPLLFRIHFVIVFFVV